MLYNLIIKEEAGEDIAQITHWYNEQSWGLGNDFLDELDKVYKHLLSFPLSNIKRYKELRFGLLNRFD